jgi:hypothetical protein
MERGAQTSVWLQLSTLYSTTKEFPILFSSLVVRLAFRDFDLITASRSAADTHRPKVLPLLDFSRDQPAHRPQGPPSCFQEQVKSLEAAQY